MLRQRSLPKQSSLTSQILPSSMMETLKAELASTIMSHVNQNHHENVVYKPINDSNSYQHLSINEEQFKI